jgi:hypothetical protein
MQSSTASDRDGTSDTVPRTRPGGGRTVVPPLAKKGKMPTAVESPVVSRPAVPTRKTRPIMTLTPDAGAKRPASSPLLKPSGFRPIQPGDVWIKKGQSNAVAAYDTDFPVMSQTGRPVAAPHIGRQSSPLLKEPILVSVAQVRIPDYDTDFPALVRGGQPARKHLAMPPERSYPDLAYQRTGSGIPEVAIDALSADPAMHASFTDVSTDTSPGEPVPAATLWAEEEHALESSQHDSYQVPSIVVAFLDGPGLPLRAPVRSILTPELLEHTCSFLYVRMRFIVAGRPVCRAQP